MRKLASIRRIDAICPIPNADNIELAAVGGWRVVVKKGEFSAGDLGVYIEIDSWVPHKIAPFLSKDTPRVFQEVAGERLRTVKLRGQISQGLLLPLSVLPTPGNEGDDVTDLLGILKWEPQLPSSLAGQIRGPFPAEIPKTEQERIQNLYPITYDGVFDITEKLDGTSCTMYLDGDAQFHVCSRNLDLKKDGRNVYWQMAIKLDIEGIMVALGLLNYALQGEIVGPGVQKNPYKLNELKFYVFDVYDVENGRYLSPPECDAFMQKNFGALVPQVPRLGITVIHLESIDDLLAFAEGKSKLADVPREGVVLRGISDDRFSFKVISNSYLLKEKDEIKIASVISESL